MGEMNSRCTELYGFIDYIAEQVFRLDLDYLDDVAADISQAAEDLANIHATDASTGERHTFSERRRRCEDLGIADMTIRRHAALATAWQNTVRLHRPHWTRGPQTLSL